MKVSNYIKVNKSAVSELLKSKAVDRIELFPDGRMVVCLLPELTDGSLECSKDDYIVQWENGKFQRFGSVAFQNTLVLDPEKEGYR
jgi:hypothetical protein